MKVNHIEVVYSLNILLIGVLPRLNNCSFEYMYSDVIVKLFRYFEISLTLITQLLIRSGSCSIIFN